MSPRPARLRDERGFMLIEVLVSAVLLVTASLAIFATLTQADTAAGNQQVRVEAANFSQSELERIRSLPVEDIMDFAKAGTRTVTRNGISFTESVQAKWVSDGGDEPQCTGTDGGLDYMRTTVTISWPNMGSIKPVSLTTLFTPNAGAGGNTGSLSVHIINRDGLPVANIPVTIKGENAGGSYNGSTNVNGCVVFGFVPQDTYDLTAQQGGYVDQDSNPTITDTPVVTATTTTKVEYTYDVSGTTATSFQTTFNGSLLGALGIPAGAVTVPSYPPHMQIWHAQQTAPGGFDIDFPQNIAPALSNPVKYPNPATETNSWSGQTAQVGLFPFATPYSVYPGTCPSNVVQDSGGKQVNISRAFFQNAGVTNIEALQIIVKDGTNSLSPGNLVPGARVMVNFGCPGAWTRITASAAAPIGTWDPTLASNASKSPWGIGTLSDPGFPWSPNIRVCVYDPVNNRYTPTYGAVNTNSSLTTNSLVIYTKAGAYTNSPPSGAPNGSCMAS